MKFSRYQALMLVAFGAVVAGLGAYLSGMFDRLPRNETPVAVSTPTPTPSAPEVASAPQGSAPSAEEAVPATPEAGAEAGSDGDGVASGEPQVPSFDLVRVEPDGSLVIAGKAANGANVELVSGASVIGSTRAGGEGDFVLILDEPLAPGDYQLVLRATNPDNSAVTSVETAVVSVPDRPTGQVLALVEQPGQPSRLITVPEAEQGTAQPSGDAAASSAAPSNDSEPEQPDVSTETPRDEPAPTDGAVTPEPAPQIAEAAPERVPEEAVQSSTQPEASPVMPQATAAAPATAGAEPPAADQPPAIASAPSAPEPAQTVPDAAASGVFVEAVEIEGRTIFVAGSARGGALVRVYANNDLLGESPVSPGGRFLVEARRDLAVGDYIIRADLLSGDGRQVAARAAVPFQRIEGEAVAAVAAPSPSPAAAASPGTRAETQAAQAGSAADAEPGPQAAVVDEAPQERAPSSSAPAPAAPAPDASDPAGTPPAAGDEPATGAPSVASQATPLVPPATEPVRSTAPQAPVVDSSERPERAIAVTDGENVPTAAALQPADSAVIIRRGDTLWQISRRVYGRGIRYSTIYVANQGQIADPDRIWPGQVFRVPEKSDDGEAEADFEAIGDRLTTVDGQEQTQSR